MSQQIKYRHELKFYVNPHQYLIIRQRLKDLMLRDGHAGADGQYHIRSLYFDDINNKALHEKLAGVRDRIKYRVRIYNLQDRLIHLEKKIKQDNYIAKMKETLTKDMLDAVLAGDYTVLNRPEKPLLYEVYREMTDRLLRPKVIVDYVREAFVARTGNVRITFDKELRTGLQATDILDKDVASIQALDENLFILEVKYDEYIPEYVRTALQLDGLRRQSASKYVLCRKHIKYNAWEDQ